MIIIACDHAGFKYKNKLIEFLQKNGEAVKDMGATIYSPQDSYITFATSACQEFVSRINENNKLILICGSGVGMSICANRYKEIRAVNPTNVNVCKLSRMHNDANCLCLGARVLSFNKIKKLTKAFLKQEFMGGRHEDRVLALNNVGKVKKDAK